MSQPIGVSHPFSRARFEAVRWTIFAVLVVAYMSVYFHRMAPAVVSSDLMIAFGTTGAALGSLAAMYYYIYTAMQIPAGVLADTIGIRAVATVGSLIAGAGSILFALADDFVLASFGRFLVGLGVSVIFVGLMKSNSVWFSERHYGLISGLTLLLGNLGSVMAAGPLAAALDIWSWREIFVALGIGSLILAVLSLTLVRNRPEEAGFPSVREIEGQRSHGKRERHWWHDLRAVLATRAVWPGFFLNFGVAGGLFAFVGLWAVPLLRDAHGLDRGHAAAYTTAALFAMAVGALFWGWLSDRLRVRKRVAIAGAGLYASATLLLVILPWTPGPLAFALFALLGFSGGSFMITYPGAKEICPPALSGMAISAVNTGLFLGAALMQPLFGWALDLGWEGAMNGALRTYSAADYARGLWLLEGFAVLGFVASLWLTETHGRQRAV